MKVAHFLVLLPVLALASPVPLAKPEADPKPEALNLLGLNIPGILDGVNILAPPSTTKPIVSIPTDKVTGALVPVVEQLGLPHDIAGQLVAAINQLLANNGIAPNGVSLLNILPAGISSDTLTKVGVSLNQILQGLLPGQDTTNLVTTVITTLQSLLNLKPTTTPSAIASGKPGVVPGVETLLKEVLGLLGTAKPNAPVGDLSAQLNAITAKLNELLASVQAGGANGLPTASLTNSLSQLLKAVYKLLSSIPLTNQWSVKQAWGPLITALAKLLGSLSSVNGVKGSLTGVLGGLQGGLGTVNGGNITAVLQNVINSVLNIPNITAIKW